MFKFKFDTSDFDTSEILDGFRSRFKTATSSLMGQVKQEGERYAGTKLKKGLGSWKKGFRVDRVTDDFYLISVEGKMASWMEDGIKTGEISKDIMHGNRAESNKGEGKNYVDVPIAKDADAAGSMSLGKKGGPSVNVKAFANADSLMKFINTSDWKKGGIKQKQVVQSRVKDIIKNVEPKSGKVSYLTIRRVTDKSVWPKSPFAGAKVLDHLDKYINANIDQIFERFL